MSTSTVIIGATLIWLAAIVSPGPNFLVVSRLALAGSRRSSIGATFGIALGSVIYAALTLFGLGLLILHFAWLGDTVRVLGGGYLIWLGIQAWRAPQEYADRDQDRSADRTRTGRHGLRVGFLTEITNPKGIAFFLGLFAAAVPSATPLWAKYAILAAGGLLEIAWYTAVSLTLSSGPARAAYQRARQTIDRAFGTLLIAAGLKVAFDAR